MPQMLYHVSQLFMMSLHSTRHKGTLKDSLLYRGQA